MSPLNSEIDNPWAIMVTPKYVQGRGQFERNGHKGYTMDWKKAGRFSEDEAKDAADASHGKYIAIPLPWPKPEDYAEDYKYEDI